MRTFSCNLNVPRTVDAVGMPNDWAQDHALSFAARGFLARLLDHAEPGTIVEEDEFGEPHLGDPSIEEMIKELVHAGYLAPSQHYRLVYPTRFAMIPSDID